MRSTSSVEQKRRRALLKGLLAAVLPVSASGAESNTSALARRAPALMQAAGVPGISLALLQEGRVLGSAQFGVCEGGQDAPVRPDTVFEAASMSKPLFAFLVMRLAAQGRLKLDEPVVRYLPEAFTPPQAWQALITARMLLCHSAGLPNWRAGEEEGVGPLNIVSEPGTAFRYSGEGYFYLQRAVEHLMGEPLQVLAQREVFGPLGMLHSSFVLPPVQALPRARGHDEAGKVLPALDYLKANAAYTLYTTASDYAQFLAAMMAPAHRALAQAMLAHQIVATDRQPIQRPGTAQGEAVFWGLGWALNTTQGQGDIAYHTGTNSTGFRCYSQFSPSRRSGWVLMTNSLAARPLWTGLAAEFGDL